MKRCSAAVALDHNAESSAMRRALEPAPRASATLCSALSSARKLRLLVSAPASSRRRGSWA